MPSARRTAGRSSTPGSTRRQPRGVAGAAGGPLAGAPVVRVLATHQHPDHIGLAGWFQARGAELWTSRASWLSARMLQLDVQDRAAPEQLAFWRAAGMSADRLAGARRGPAVEHRRCRSSAAAGLSADGRGQVVRLGGRDWRRRDGRRPRGRTPDAVVAGRRSGDRRRPAAPGISPNLGVYPTEPDADPVQAWLDSCARLALLAEPRHVVLPGHKLPFTGLPQRLVAMAENHERALTRLRRVLADRRGPRSAASRAVQAQHRRRRIRAGPGRGGGPHQHVAPSRPYRGGGGHKGRRHAVGGVTASALCASTCGEHRRTR